METKRRLVLFFAIVGLPAAVICAAPKGQYMGICPLKISIHVAIFEKSRALVTATYENVSDGDIWVLLDEPNLYVKQDGKDIQDIGPSEKRAAYTIKDYERVKPRTAIRRQVEISEQFDFLPGTHEYTIQTGGGYKDPVTGRDWNAPPSVAKFLLTR